MAPFTFLVTGASGGLGLNIALAALKAGHGVVAAARNVPKAKESNPEVEQKGGHWITLDVTSPDTQNIVEKAVKEHNVNVVVNNAGYALRGVLENLSMSSIRAQIETNVFGALAVTKGSIPTLRSNKNGTIVNISSTSGISGSAGNSLYAASKFALEGASESLAAELAPFNIRVLLVEPGGFRTNFQMAVEGVGGELIGEAYKGTAADEFATRLRGGHGKQPGDPEKAGQAIVEVVTGKGRGEGLEWEGLLRLPLGKDAVTRAKAKVKSFDENIDKVRHISEWAVFDE